MFTYYVCAECGHIETRPSDVESPGSCEHCRRSCEHWIHDDLDAALDESDDIVRHRAEWLIAERLEYLRAELRAERISYGDLAELQDLAEHIPADDVELREAAGLPEVA